MKKTIALVFALALLVLAWSCCAEGTLFDYRFADADEAAELLLGNRGYYENLSQNDLNFRMQKLDATLEELEAFAAAQTLDYTDEEKAAIDAGIAHIKAVCAERGYALPYTQGIVFCKTTMREECDTGGYTHGTQIYLGEVAMEFAFSDDPGDQDYFHYLITHELFHCLTRNHPEFRTAMYNLLGFTVQDEDFPIARSIMDRVISNPDIGRHNSWAAFEIGGELKNCVVVFTTGKPFEQPGDNFFDEMATGLVPIDDLSVMYTSDEAANFWEVFGKNTDYVVDPEETLADNFAFTIIYGLDGMAYETPELIEAIDGLLKAGVVSEAA